MRFYRKDIDGLRAISVYAVIFFHIGLKYKENLIFSGGYIGVDVFFVISGFLISSIVFKEIEDNKFSILSFYNRRARRILPIFTFVGLISSILSFYFFLPGDLLEFSKSLLSSIFFSSNFFFWKNTGYFFGGNELKPLIHTWSLSVEEQFYILFPLIVLLILRYLKKLMLPLFVLILFSSIILAEIESRDGSAGAFYLLPTRAWELISGVLCFFFLNQKIIFSKTLKEFLSFIGLSAVIISLIFFKEEFTHPGLITLIPVIGTMLIIIFGNQKTLTYKFLANKVLVFNGLISYSLYMWHQPILAILKYTVGISNLFEQFILVLSLIVVSAASWKYLEKPARDRNRISNKVFFSSTLFTLLFILSFSVVGISSQGLLKKYPEKDHNLLLNDNQYGRYTWGNSSEIEMRKFSNKNTLKVLIIGDSFSQDFLNSIIEAKLNKNIEMSWMSINFKCKKKPLIDIKCLKKNLENENIVKNLIKSSNVVFLSMAWSEKRHFKDLRKLLVHEKYKEFFDKVTIVGSKQFKFIENKKWTRLELLKLDDSERLNLKTRINKQLISFNLEMEKVVGKNKFLNLIDI